jgi:hypothetical protein
MKDRSEGKTVTFPLSCLAAVTRKPTHGGGPIHSERRLISRLISQMIVVRSNQMIDPSINPEG